MKVGIWRLGLGHAFFSTLFTFFPLKEGFLGGFYRSWLVFGIKWNWKCTEEGTTDMNDEDIINQHSPRRSLGIEEMTTNASL